MSVEGLIALTAVLTAVSIVAIVTGRALVDIIRALREKP